MLRKFPFYRNNRSDREMRRTFNHDMKRQHIIGEMSNFRLIIFNIIGRKNICIFF